MDRLYNNICKYRNTIRLFMTSKYTIRLELYIRYNTKKRRGNSSTTNNLIRFSLFVRGWPNILHNICVVFNGNCHVAVSQKRIIVLDHATFLHEFKFLSNGLNCYLICRVIACFVLNMCDDV